MAAAVTPPDPVASPFVLRAEVDGDRHYVLSTWKRSEGEAVGSVEGRRFGPWQEKMMRDILTRPGVTVTVAGPHDDDSIGGWMVAQVEPMPCIYYVFVRPELRRLGLARLMVGDLATRPVAYTRRPPRVLGPNGWQPPSWFARVVPKPWRLLERASYYPLDLADSGASGAWRGR